MDNINSKRVSVSFAMRFLYICICSNENALWLHHVSQSFFRLLHACSLQPSNRSEPNLERWIQWNPGLRSSDFILK